MRKPRSSGVIAIPKAHGVGVPDTSSEVEAAAAFPLCVDLDGTVIRTDLLMESLVALLRRTPWLLFWVPVYLWRGRAALKRWLAQNVLIDPVRLPYNSELLVWLRQSRDAGRRLIVVTGSDEGLARQVGDHIGIFHEVRGSDGRTNLTGRRKAEALVEAFGAGGFDYVGNSGRDIGVWSYCRAAIVVGSGQSLVRRAGRVAAVERTFPSRRTRMPWLREMRVHQWLKNVLVFSPIIAGHQLLNPTALSHAALAFIAFSLCASGVYVVNDLLDLEVDRKHPIKSQRPLASGELSIAHAVLLAVTLLTAGVALSALLPVPARILLLAYIVITHVYSIVLKRKLLIDVFTLSGLYTLRIVAGGAAADITVSTWMLSFLRSFS